MADKVLIVDDDISICKLLEKVMHSNELDTEVAGSGKEALELLKHHTYDVILMDIMLGDMEGFDVIKELRASGIQTPVMIVSGRNEDYDSLYGLSIGADDYITKPFNFLELIARVKAQLRRYTKFTSFQQSNDELFIRGLYLNKKTKEVKLDDKPVRLTPIEFKILQLLMENPDVIFSIQEIYEKVWNEPFINSENTVAVHIRRIREKIEVDPKEPMYLKVVWGIGYKISK